MLNSALVDHLSTFGLIRCRLTFEIWCSGFGTCVYLDWTQFLDPVHFVDKVIKFGYRSLEQWDLICNLAQLTSYNFGDVDDLDNLCDVSDVTSG